MRLISFQIIGVMELSYKPVGGATFGGICCFTTLFSAAHPSYFKSLKRTSSTELKALNWFSLCFEALTIQWNLLSSSSSSSYFTKRVMGNFTNRQNEFPLAFFFFLAQALVSRIQILSLSKVLILKSLLLFNSEIWIFSGVAWQHSQQYSFKHLL